MENKGINGLFEIHVTVEGKLDRFLETCSRQHLKPVLIQLPYGESPRQLMTSSWTTGTETNAIEKAKEIAKQLKSEDYNILRVKVESTASNEGVPINSPPTNPDLYFEFHIKIRVTEKNEQSIQEISKKHDAHLSLNYFKSKDFPDIKFITLRIYHAGKTEAFRKLNLLLDDLKKSGEDIISVQKEFAVFDTNISLDRGWIDKLDHDGL